MELGSPKLASQRTRNNGLSMTTERKYMENIKISEVLQREFRTNGLSVGDVARRCGIPTRTLNDWHTGKTKPSAKTLGHTQTLADFLKISLNHLLFNIVDEETKADIISSTTFKDGTAHYRVTIEKLEEPK